MEPELRIEILERDQYRCQNKGCKYAEARGIKNSSLEVHHLVERTKYKNDPELKKKVGHDMDDSINLVTLCTTCHRRYHCGVKILSINGKEYETSVPERFNWKLFKHEMKQLRREYRSLWGRRLTADEVIMLMIWLFG